ncbi:MAG: hypothetical protein PHE24_02525 [Patescibacteria group bacterium]|nr:hypothetical protein [Patescibacteria group bacterium]
MPGIYKLVRSRSGTKLMFIATLPPLPKVKLTRNKIAELKKFLQQPAISVLRLKVRTANIIHNQYAEFLPKSRKEVLVRDVVALGENVFLSRTNAGAASYLDVRLALRQHDLDFAEHLTADKKRLFRAAIFPIKSQ